MLAGALTVIVAEYFAGHCKIRWQAYGQMEGFQRLCSRGIKHKEGYITQPGIELICPDSSTIERVAAVHFPTSFDFELRMIYAFCIPNHAKTHRSTRGSRGNLGAFHGYGGP